MPFERPSYIQAGLSLAIALAGCQAPPVTGTGSGLVFSLDPREEAAAPATPTDRPAEPARGAIGLNEPDAPTPAVPDPAPDATPPPPMFGGAGGSVSAPAAPLAPPEVETPMAPGSRLLVLPNGRQIQIPAGDTVTLPPDATGEVTLYMPGRVPSTIDLSGPTLPTQLHPRADTTPTPAGVPTGRAPVSGIIGGALSGVAIAYESRRHLAGVGATSGAAGAFQFEVPLAEAEEGLVIARDNTAAPRLALMRVFVIPGMAADLSELVLAEPTGVIASPPTLPPGMRVARSALRVAAGPDDDPFLSTVVAVGGDGALPAYDLSGFATSVTIEAGSADGLTASTVTAPPEDTPTFLAPPDLSALTTRPRPGSRLTWPGISNVGLYTLWLADAANPQVPLWEAATTASQVTVPSGLSLAGRELVLQVTAWDAPEVSLYSVASARQLRVPVSLPGVAGRSSRSIKRYVL